MMSTFRCVKTCGYKCCSFQSEEETPLVYPWEKRFIENLVGKQLFKPYMCYSKGRTLAVLLYRWVINGVCVFLKENECLIHSDKPLSCKMYPLIIGLDDNTLRMSSLCPYASLEEARLRPEDYFSEEYRVALKNYVLLKLVDEYMMSYGWSRVLNPKVNSQNVVRDIDELIEIPEINV